MSRFISLRLALVALIAAAIVPLAARAQSQDHRLNLNPLPMPHAARASKRKPPISSQPL